MKRLLLTFILCLLAPAGVDAQRKGYVEFRSDDAFNGHVKSVRIETAIYAKADGAVVEGQRRLSTLANYSPDGKRKEEENYEPDGSLRNRYVHVYDHNGAEVEQSKYDGQNNLLGRVVFRTDTGETLTYDGEGTLKQRVERVSDENGSSEVRTYDGSGALVRRDVRDVNASEFGKSVWKTYGPDGSLVGDATASKDSDGRNRNEQNHYKSDGSVVGRTTITDDQSGKNFDVVRKDKDGRPQSRTRQTREYDSRKNPLKLTHYAWDDAANDFVPSSVSYYIITYYD